jgi:GT2 family glycosyltransferase
MSNTTPTLAWTGERMIPFVSDYATQATHWQRYLYFRPWYEDARVVDAACGEGYGTDFGSIFAASSTGVDVASEAVDYANATYPTAKFFTEDACEWDYSQADFVTSFETIEHLPDPTKFLKAVSACKGRIVISTPNRRMYDPNAKLGDTPSNPFHTIEWTAEEFAELIESHFPDRTVRYLSQSTSLPGRLYEGLDPNGWFTIAVIGEGEFPQWPKIGFSMPTVNNAQQGIDSISAYVTYYPGEMEFAVVLNGTSDEQKELWRAFAAQTGGMVTLIEQDTNLGYGIGSNIGLEYLQKKGGFDAYGVTNDDVYPSLGCMTEMAHSLIQLKKAGENPGILGVVSNRVNGKQSVEIGEYNDMVSMMRQANNHLREHKSSATPWPQIRGLCFLMTPECLEKVGGFDPIFGLGNFEDDDLSLRIRLAGFTSWIVDGAFLYHQGSQTFGSLNINYEANIARNTEIFNRKWELHQHEQFIVTEHKPENVSLYVPLNARFTPIHEVTVHTGETLDLVNQASNMEFALWVYTLVTYAGKDARECVVNAIVAGANSQNECLITTGTAAVAA